MGIHRNPPSKTVDNEKENQEITILSDSDEPTDLEIQPSGSLQIPDEDQGKEDTKYWACPICSDVWEEGKNMVECDMCKYWHHWWVLLVLDSRKLAHFLTHYMVECSLKIDFYQIF